MLNFFRISFVVLNILNFISKNLHLEMLRIANSLRRTHTLQSFYVASLHGSSAAYSDEKSADIPTHTGQVWDADDMRLARFEVAPKQVNSQWANKFNKRSPSKAC
ncbi:hypothetical protein Avbf_13128 [Armadillidium vulgare]|nr:hypothetical protein Avbf_13128 [Armadillidium vulgare]